MLAERFLFSLLKQFRFLSEIRTESGWCKRLNSVQLGDAQAAADLDGVDGHQRADAVIEIEQRLTVQKHPEPLVLTVNLQLGEITRKRYRLQSNDAASQNSGYSSVHYLHQHHVSVQSGQGSSWGMHSHLCRSQSYSHSPLPCSLYQNVGMLTYWKRESWHEVNLVSEGWLSQTERCQSSMLFRILGHAQQDKFHRCDDWIRLVFHRMLVTAMTCTPTLLLLHSWFGENMITVHLVSCWNSILIIRLGI